jgi:hypothetical protein
MAATIDLPLGANAEKPSFWNPLQGGGRSKAWAEDAKAKISYFKFKLETIRTRNAAERPTSEASEGRVATTGGSDWPASAPGIAQPIDADIASTATATDRRTPSPAELDVTCHLVNELLSRAAAAAAGISPRYRPFWGWWSGAGIEAAYRNLHYAEASIARLYNKEEVRAETPEVVRRARVSLAEDDPNRRFTVGLLGPGDSVIKICKPEELSALISLGHEASDRNRAKLRTFRNVVLVGSIIMSVLLAVLVGLAARWPDLIPLCFTQDPPPASPTPAVACPTAAGASPAQQPLPGLQLGRPQAWDVFIVALLGLVGGALSVAVFIRGMYSNTTPYNVAVPLSLLKLPVGAISAIVGMILVAGDFVPGFSAIDKQAQILAYAVVFGFSQQLFTKTLDRRAENLIADLPTASKPDAATPPRQSSA